MIQAAIDSETDGEEKVHAPNAWEDLFDRTEDVNHVRLSRSRQRPPQSTRN